MEFVIICVPIIVITISFLVKKVKIKNFVSLIFFGIISIILTMMLNYVIIKIFPQLDIPKEDYVYLNISSLFIVLLFVAGISEELAKYISIKLTKPKNKDEILINSLYVSLIFTIVEDYLYIIEAHRASIGYMRTLVPGHLIFQCIMLIFMIKAEELRKNKKIILSVILEIMAVVIPIILHALFDTMIFDISGIIKKLIIIVICIISYGMPILLIFRNTYNENSIKNKKKEGIENENKS